MFGDNTNDNANDQQGFGGTQPTINTPVNNDAGTPRDLNTATPSAPDVPAEQQPDTTNDYANVSQPEPTQEPDPNAVSRPEDTLPTPSTEAASADDLLNIKQQALQQLTPLVDHLEQTPDEEFRTTMMMIQATDNQELVKKAFEAAQKIQDDKKRAQAFLDIINEINYFTQQHEQ